MSHHTTTRLLAKACRENLLDPKWIIGKTLRIGNQWKERLNRDGTSAFNLHAKTFGDLANHAAAASMHAKGLRLASNSIIQIIAGQVISEICAAGRFKYFANTEQSRSLAQLFARTFLDLKLSGLHPNNLQPSQFESRKKAEDIQTLWAELQSSLSRNGLCDPSDVLRIAIANAGEIVREATAGDPSQSLMIIVLDPDEAYCELESELLSALAKHATVIRTIDRGTKVEDGLEFSARRIAAKKTQFQIQAASGEANEIRGMLHKISASNQRLDQVEVLHTDYATYVPLIYETLCDPPGDDSCIEEIPATFAEGIACIYFRPGRALRAWLRWLRNDCAQHQLVQMIREGLLNVSPARRQGQASEQGIGFARLASSLRRLPIGWKRERYQPLLEQAELEATRRSQLKPSSESQEARDYGLTTLSVLRQFITTLLETSPNPGDSPESLIDAAKAFVKLHARSLSKLDQHSSARLLDALEGMRQSLEFTDGTELDLWNWLEELPVQSHVMASGPRAGCMHVDHITRGGFSGRDHLILLGLDDSRFPIRIDQDPLLLDFERRHISTTLPTSVNHSARECNRFRSIFGDERKHLTLSYATRSLAADKLLFPSSSLLDAFRILSGNSTANESDLIQHAGEVVSFLDEAPQQLRQHQHSMIEILNASAAQRQSILETGHPHWREGRMAQEKIDDSTQATAFDGLVPEAGTALDPTAEGARHVSASQLETFGACPRRYFFRYGLRLRAPDELLMDEHRWLDAASLGSLVHQVFEEFLIELTAEERSPSLEQDRLRLMELLHYAIADARERVPSPNLQAYERQVQDLEKTCEIFLRSEEEYCRTTGAVPFVMEATVGGASQTKTVLDCVDPISLALPNGQSIKVAGIIDRVDRIGEGASQHYAIWDYKSGSSWSYDQADPFRGGRKLQPTLYLGLLRHRLKDKLGEDPNVGYFGYFFPSPANNGLRLQWTSAELDAGSGILQQVVDLISNGVFLPTTNEQDCTYCDYREICGEPKQVAEAIRIKLTEANESAFDDYVALRSKDLEGKQS